MQLLQFANVMKFTHIQQKEHKCVAIHLLYYFFCSQTAMKRFYSQIFVSTCMYTYKAVLCSNLSVKLYLFYVWIQLWVTCCFASRINMPSHVHLVNNFVFQQ